MKYLALLSLLLCACDRVAERQPASLDRCSQYGDMRGCPEPLQVELLALGRHRPAWTRLGEDGIWWSEAGRGLFRVAAGEAPVELVPADQPVVQPTLGRRFVYWIDPSRRSVFRVDRAGGDAEKVDTLGEWGGLMGWGGGAIYVMDVHRRELHRFAEDDDTPTVVAREPAPAPLGGRLLVAEGIVYWQAGDAIRRLMPNGSPQTVIELDSPEPGQWRQLVGADRDKLVWREGDGRTDTLWGLRLDGGVPEKIAIDLEWLVDVEMGPEGIFWSQREAGVIWWLRPGAATPHPLVSGPSGQAWLALRDGQLAWSRALQGLVYLCTLPGRGAAPAPGHR